MKRNHLQSTPHCHGHHRSGAIFAYVMAYMTLSMLLLGLTGTTLHLLMRTSQTDQRLFRDLSRIADVESAIRQDARQADQIRITDTEAVFSVNSGTVIWTITDNRITREETHDKTRAALMSVVFRHTTELAFITQSESLFALRIIPPAPAATSASKKTSTTSNTVLRPVEILLPRPPGERLSLTKKNRSVQLGGRSSR